MFGKIETFQHKPIDQLLTAADAWETFQAGHTICMFFFRYDKYKIKATSKRVVPKNETVNAELFAPDSKLRSRHMLLLSYKAIESLSDRRIGSQMDRPKPICPSHSLQLNNHPFNRCQHCHQIKQTSFISELSSEILILKQETLRISSNK